MEEQKTIWIVSYTGDKGEPVITAFDNPLAAMACKECFISMGRYTELDECPIYGSFIE